MAKKERNGNDQAPKPALGNMKGLHGIKSVDWSGGANPPSRNPRKGNANNKRGR